MTRHYKGPQGLFWETLIRSMGGGKFLARYLRQTLAILEKEERKA
jgi:hypothetical protein